MNRKHLTSTLLVITILITFVTSGCSQTRSPRQSHQATAAPHTQSPRNQQIRPRTTQQYPISSRFHERRRIVDIANRTLGTRYRYGGRNPQSGFDCSGLMHYVHKQSLGINIPRTAAEQRDRSKTITYEQLQPGDMLFFKTGKRTNHVGVYIGNREFIHASTGSRRVKVAKMDKKYWHQRFVKFGTFL